MFKMGEKCICIVPARGGSKRVPKKNLIQLYGKPMISYTIEAAKNSMIFDKIVVSSDNAEILRVAKNYDIAIHKRSKELAGDKATVIQVCLDLIEEYEKNNEFYDLVCVLLPTSPLRTEKHIKEGFDLFQSKDADGLMGVTEYDIPPFWALTEKEGHLSPFFGHKYMVKSQELPKVVVDNGALYFIKTEVLKSEKTFYCNKLVGYRMARKDSIDIDEKIDHELAEFFMKK